METHDTWENRGKLVVPQKPTYNFVKLFVLKAMQLSPLSVHHLISFFALDAYLYPPRAHGHQKGWSGFILWAGASEAGQSPNSTHWHNQMTSLIRPWDAATEALCEPASTQKFTLVFGFSQLTARIQRSDWFGGQKVDQWGPICERTAVWTEWFTKCS